MSDTPSPLSDDLNKPLGGMSTKARKSGSQRLSASRVSLPSFTQTLYVVLGFCVIGFGGFAIVAKNPLGGEPYVISEIVKEHAQEVRVDRPEDANASPVRSQNVTPQRSNGRADASQLEADAGVSVVRAGGESAPNSVVIRLNEPVTIKLNSAPDQRVSERTRFGVLPKVGQGGIKPMQVYARQAAPTLASGQQPIGRIALVVGGLGISQSVTQEAISKLPPAVTLAFAPYGSDLERHVTKARDDGHEVMLQVPMEPFDYPDSDPGPHTLTVSGKPEENNDKLQWVLGRFSGYVGIINYMGAKLTADQSAFSKIAQEIGQRGLFFMDDGTSVRSQALIASKNVQTKATKADVVVDAVARGDMIDKELAKLEVLAREKGVVVANASALPITLERLARWSETLESRGIMLVPVSSVVLEDSSLLTGTTPQSKR